MRDKNQNFIQFRRNLSSHVEKILSNEVIPVLRKPVAVNPTFLCDSYKFKFPVRKLANLRSLALLSYWLPETIAWKIRLELWEYSSKLNLRDQLKLKLLLNTKEEAIAYFHCSDEFHSNEFYGNFLREGVKALKALTFYKRTERVERPQRKRGYNDKGSRAENHCWVEDDLGWEGDLLHNELTLKRKIHIKAYNRLRIYLSREANL